MRHRPNALMLFAAGFGTRMGALTANQPKPLIKVAGKTLIDHTLDLAQPCGFETTVANLHYKPEMLEAHLSGTNVQTLREEPDILETGGGLRNALPLLGDRPVVTSNTDAIWQGPNPFEQALEAWDPEKMDALLVCTPLPQCVGHTGAGDFKIDDDGRLTRGTGDVVYGGIQVLKTTGLHDIEDDVFSLNVLWNQMLEEGRLYGVKYPGQWCDVGRPDGIELAETMLENANV
ncbi:nucleotidyltransferase family protein [Cognatishimia activa]|uniref:Glucose-1-phosphate adenylyltransferase n=1 Tax=Cognatishimia activa TaxID=1715691 RepID=A0A0P1ILS3_9RHOB|nr:nucleotidyltransferase family protein [Cognatishimia activa]CUI40660.1 glucose-1-phosphate adenylyltransferase [Cognatishimia activa]CUK24555.1 glucose-1-phosphate adenylyltransferase [Cognatishimia activa]